jgi:beta-galactosidase
MPGAKLWSPESPHLYDLQLQLLDARLGAVDSVQSYVGIRSVGKQQDEEGHWRMTLNGRWLLVCLILFE